MGGGSRQPRPDEGLAHALASRHPHRRAAAGFRSERWPSPCPPGARGGSRVLAARAAGGSSSERTCWRGGRVWAREERRARLVPIGATLGSDLHIPLTFKNTRAATTSSVDGGWRSGATRLHHADIGTPLGVYQPRGIAPLSSRRPHHTPPPPPPHPPPPHPFQPHNGGQRTGARQRAPVGLRRSLKTSHASLDDAHHQHSTGWIRLTCRESRTGVIRCRGRVRPIENDARRTRTAPVDAELDGKLPSWPRPYRRAEPVRVAAHLAVDNSPNLQPEPAIMTNTHTSATLAHPFGRYGGALARARDDSEPDAGALMARNSCGWAGGLRRDLRAPTRPAKTTARARMSALWPLRWRAGST